MILSYLRNPGDGIDVIQATFSWPQPLAAGPFEQAWQHVTARHEALRTVFGLDDGDGLIQAADPGALLDIRWRQLPPPAADGDEAFEAFLRADRRERFDPVARPPVRLTIIDRATSGAGPGRAGVGQAVLTFHHALLDGHSLRLLAEEVAAAYGALRAGRRPAQRPGPQLGEFARWWQQAAAPAGQFWARYLAGISPPRPLPGYLGEPQEGHAEAMTAEVVLSRADSDLVRQAASALGLSRSTMLSAAWALLRARYSGSTDVAIGLTRSVRRDAIAGAEAIIGPLINTVPLRVRFDDGWSVRQLVMAAQESLRQVREHQRAPMGPALRAAGLPADSALIDCLLVFSERRLECGLRGAAAPGSARMDRLSSYPLMLCAYDEPQLRMSLHWDRRRLAAGSPERMLAQLRDTLAELAAGLDKPLAALDLGRAAERDLVARWNQGGAACPAAATIPALFAAAVARSPQATALEFGDAAMSYAELDRRATALAGVLRRRGVRADTPVGVAMERGPELITALLAVAKAGGCYVPLGIGAPPGRITAMISAAGAKLVLVTAETAGAIPEQSGAQLLQADAVPASQPGGGDGVPADAAHPLALAYISFTSGSTGTPKGVAVPHLAVARLVTSPTFATLGPGQRVLHMAPVAFDASTLEIWGALATGATMVIAPPGPLSLTDVAAVLRGRRVSVAWLTAGLFHQLAETDSDAIAGVPLVLAGGDVLSPATVRSLLAARGGRPLVNGYGPTENTTFTACHVMSGPAAAGDPVPVGRPIQHTTAHVLDAGGRPSPVGVTGELHAGGAGLARGYAGSPAATARAFVPDPWGHGTRLYRTGDLARWRADGVLEFAGRADDQVKIRGFRVEPGEVAAALRSHPGVAEAVVLVAGEGEQRYLTGYVVPADGADAASLRPSALRDFLAARLPDYLVPAGFKAVARLPLNANGKVDRSALPAPERESLAPASPPQTGTEERLAAIWKLLLPADGPRGGDIGREDSFFALGGNSLSGARMMFRIRESFGVDLQMAAFYEAPTLAASAAAIDAAVEATRPAGRPAGLRPSPGAIARRDRSAYRVAAGPAAATAGQGCGLAPHLVPLAGDWALWRTVCLRGAGLPVRLLTALGDPGLAAAADAALALGVPGTAGPAAAGLAAREQAEAAYGAEFDAGVRRVSAALHAAACLPALREAVGWQNRHALATGIDPVARRGPDPARRNAQHRQHQALVASYLQRYCAKNDTIGFFGPVGWSRIDDGPGIRISHAAPQLTLSSRVTYLEGWAVQAVMAPHAQALRPWLIPRRMPYAGLDGMLLRLPLAPPVPLTPAQAAVLRACDGIRDARAVVAGVLADPASGVDDPAAAYQLLGQLAAAGRVAWDAEAAPHDTRPERAMQTLLARVTDDAVREPAQAALDELAAARDELAACAGDAGRVAGAMADLESAFTRLARVPATRRAGQLYAGRTLAYEECLRGDTVALGAGTLDGLREPLALVLDAARWFTAQSAVLFARYFQEAYDARAAALGTAAVPLADIWMLVSEGVTSPSLVIAAATREARQRWAAITGAAAGARRVQLRAADLREQVTAAFPARPLPWPTAVHHSPDLMIAGAGAGPGTADGERVTWVLGEVHPSVVTIRYATWVEFAAGEQEMRAGLRRDLRGPAVWFAESGHPGGTATRLSNVLASPGDRRLIFSSDSCGYDPALAIPVGDCDVTSSPAGLRVRRRDGSFEAPLLEVLGDLVATSSVNHFDLAPAGEHAPRVTIDDLVVSRETWRLPAAEPQFAATAGERARYLQARAWAARHGMPRYLFFSFAGEKKPVYADMTSLASVDLVSRALRRSLRVAGPQASVRVTEMLPAPDQAWLTDGQGQRYAAEVRMVAADQVATFHRGEG